MVKQSTAVLELFSSVLKDAKRAFPELSSTFNELLLFSENYVRTRGHEEYLYVMLPEVGKALDKGLSDGIYEDPQAGVGACPYKRHTPLGKLLSQVFEGTGHIHAEVDVDLIFFLRTILYMHKKVKIDCPKERVNDSVQEFIDIEGSLRTPSGSWRHDVWLPSRFTFSDHSFPIPGKSRTGSVGELLDRVFGHLVPHRELDMLGLLPRHGPGAVSDVATGMDKFQFPFWPQKLEGSFPYVRYAQSREDLHFDEDRQFSLREPPGKLLAVPKTYKGPRLITSEPTAHQYIQQGILRWLRKNLTKPLRLCVDFSSQEKSRALTIEASKTGQLATVDLSSASDRLSCWTVERAFGFNQSLLAALHACRTRTVVNSTGSSHTFELLLKKFAGQGSAVTFPIQSIVYAGCSIAALLYDWNVSPSKGNVLAAARKVQVFGDDIIIPSSSVRTLGELLSSLQLKVNLGKTHNRGTFRESCGMDAFNGYDVTPLYVSEHTPRSKPDSIASWIDVSNNAHRKGCWVTAAEMTSLIKPIRNIPVNCSSGLSLFSYVATELPTSKIRYNANLHRWECRSLTLSVVVQEESRRETSQNLLKFFLEYRGFKTPFDPDNVCYRDIDDLSKYRLRLRKRWVPFNLT